MTQRLKWLPVHAPPTGTTASSWKQTAEALKFQLLAALTPAPKLLSLSAWAGAANARLAKASAATEMIFFMACQRVGLGRGYWVPARFRLTPLAPAHLGAAPITKGQQTHRTPKQLCKISDIN